jgi:peroxiredoxin
MNDEDYPVRELLRMAVDDVRRPVAVPAGELIAKARRGRRLRRTLGAVTAVAATAALVTGVGLVHPSRAAPVLSGPAAGSAVPAAGRASWVDVPGVGRFSLIPPDRRQAAPALTGRDLDGGSVSLAQFRGKVVVVDFWGSWCAPCQAQAQGVESVAAASAAQGVRFLGVDVSDPAPSAARAYQARYGLSYPSLSDPDRVWAARFPRGVVDAQAFPGTVILDQDGRIAVAGPPSGLTGPELKAVLGLVLGHGG